MTLLPIQNQLIQVFCEKDTFSASDFATIKVIPELNDRRDDIVRAALSNLVEAGMIKPAGEGLWILSQPLNAAGQEVHLSMPICNEIASIINTDLEAKGIEERVDALNLHEGHVVALISIIDEILGNEGDE